MLFKESLLLLSLKYAWQKVYLKLSYNFIYLKLFFTIRLYYFYNIFMIKDKISIFTISYSDEKLDTLTTIMLAVSFYTLIYVLVSLLFYSVNH